MHARHLRWSTLVAFAALTAACADSSIAPAPEQAEMLPGGAPRPAIIINQMAADESSADFTVTPTGGYFRMGKHGIVFPRNAICDPATSSYGREHWDEDCDVLRTPIQIHAELRVQDGREWVDFSPELRFRPSPYPFQWVWIYMSTSAAQWPNGSLSILWSPAIGVPGIDESLEDPTLRTYVSPWSGYAYRRIKHFSGYNVTSGRSATTDDAREVVSEQP
ncbi:MAG TPA: hypothetical protein VH638_06585 [Gemmatimonadaceae bacterium]